MNWVSYALLFVVTFVLSGAYFYVRGGSSEASQTFENWNPGPGSALVDFYYTEKLKTNFIVGRPNSFRKADYSRLAAKKTELATWPSLSRSKRIRLHSEMPNWVRRKSTYKNFYADILNLNSDTYKKSLRTFYSMEASERRALLSKLFRDGDIDPIVLRRLAIFIKYSCQKEDLGVVRALLEHSVREGGDRMIVRYLVAAIQKWRPSFTWDSNKNLPDILR